MIGQQVPMDNGLGRTRNIASSMLFGAYSLRLTRAGDIIKIIWFCIDRAKPIGCYNLLIQDYEPGNRDQENSLDECFTARETEQLYDYLEKTHGMDLEVDDITIPLPGNTMPYGAFGMDTKAEIDENGYVYIANGMNGRYVLSDEDSYDLPFKVVGYCELKPVFT